jgi:hypothetical protein
MINDWAEGLQKNCDDGVTVNIYRLHKKNKCSSGKNGKPITIMYGNVCDVCNHRPTRRSNARRHQMKIGMTTAQARKLAKRAGLTRVPGVAYDERILVSSDGHTNESLIGTQGGGEGPWIGVPSTPTQKRGKAYALHTRVEKSKIPGAGLGLFMQEKARPNDRVAIYSGKLLTKEQADQSASKYIVQVGKYYLDGEDTSSAVGRYVNYAPAQDANARLRAGTKPTWDERRQRWWISIRATKNIGPNEEIRMSYGQTYKGLPGRKKVVPAM